MDSYRHFEAITWLYLNYKLSVSASNHLHTLAHNIRLYIQKDSFSLRAINFFLFTTSVFWCCFCYFCYNCILTFPTFSYWLNIVRMLFSLSLSSSLQSLCSMHLLKMYVDWRYFLFWRILIIFIGVTLPFSSFLKRSTTR